MSSVSGGYHTTLLLYEALRLPVIHQNGVTVIVAMMILVPLAYVVLLLAGRYDEASGWLKANISHYSLVMHFLNFVPFATFEHCFIAPRRLNMFDFWVTMAMGLV